MPLGNDEIIELIARVTPEVDPSALRDLAEQLKMSPTSPFAKNFSQTVAKALKRALKDAIEGALGDIGKGAKVSSDLAALGRLADRIDDVFAKSARNLRGDDSIGAAMQQQVSQVVDATRVIVANFADLAKAMEIRAEDAVRNINKLEQLQARKPFIAQQVEAEKRVTEALRQQGRERLRVLETTNSLTRIREQGEQQRRLARTQAFYSAMSRLTQSFGQQAAQVAGQWVRRLTQREEFEQGRRLSAFRRSNSEIEAIERRGSEARLSLSRQFWVRRRQIDQAGLAASSALAGATVGEQISARTSTGLLGFATGRSTAASLLPVAGGLGAFGSVKKALNLSNEFRASMAKLEAATGATGEQLNQLSQYARQLGKDVTLPGVSTVDAVQAFTQLAVSGIKLQDVLQGAGRDTLLLSRALEVDAVEAAKSIASAINVFGLSGEQTSKVVDGLALASQRSGASLSELNEALQQSAISFAQTFREVDGSEASFQNLNAVIASFARNGLRGSDAGTSLKTALQFLGGKSDEARELLSKFTKSAGYTGSVLYDAEGRTRKFSEVLKILREGFKKFPTDAERANFVAKVFGTDASRSAQILKSLTDQELSEFIDKVNEGTVATRLAAAANSGWKGGIDALVSVLEDLGLTIGNLVSPAIRSIAVGIAELVGNLMEGDGVFRSIRFALAGVAVAAASLVSLKLAAQSASVLRLAFIGLIQSLGPFGVAFFGVSAILGIVAGESESLRETLNALVGAFKRLGSLVFDKVASALAVALRALTPVLQGVARGVESAFVEVEEFVRYFTTSGWQKVWEVAGDPIKKFASLVRNALGRALTLVSGAARFFRRLVQSLFGGIGDIAGRASKSISPLEFVASRLARAFRAISAALSVSFELIGEGFRGITGGGGIVGFLRGVGESARDFLDLIQQIARNISSAFGGGGTLGGRLRRLFTDLGPIINDLLFGLPEKIGGIVRTYILDPIDRAFAGLAGWWARFFGDGITSPAVFRALFDIGRKIGRQITSMLTNPTFLKTVAIVLASAAAAAVSAVAGVIAGAIEKLADRFREAVRGIPIFGELLAGLGGFISKFSAAITAAIVAALSVGLLRGPITRLAGAVSGAVSGGRAALALSRGDTSRAAEILARERTSRRDQALAGLNARVGEAAAKALGFLPTSKIEALLDHMDKVGTNSAERLDRGFRSRLKSGAQRRFSDIRTALFGQINMTRRVMEQFSITVPGISDTKAFAKTLPKKNANQLSISNLFTNVGEAGRSALTALNNGVRAIPGLVQRAVADASNALRRFDRVALATAARVILATGDRGARIIDSVSARVSAVSSRLIDTPIKRAFDRAISFASQSARRIGDAGRAAASSFSNAFSGGINSLAQKSVPILNRLAQFGRSAFDAVFGVKITSEIPQRFAGLVQRLGVDGFKLQSIFDKIGSKVRGTFDSIRSAFSGGAGKERLLMGLETAAIGLFSGVGLASDNAVAKLGGVLGAFSAIATALAVGGPVAGPILAGITAITTGVGFFISRSQEAKEKIRQFGIEVVDLRDKLVDAAKSSSVGVVVADELSAKFKEFEAQNRLFLQDVKKLAPDIEVQIRSAFSSAVTRGGSKAFADLRRGLLRELGGKTINFFDEGPSLDGIISKPFRKAYKSVEKELDGLGARIIYGNGGYNRLRFTTEKAAREAAGLLQGALERLASRNEIPVRLALDKVSYKKVSDGLFEITRQGFTLDGIAGGQAALDDLASKILAISEAAKEAGVNISEFQKDQLANATNIAAQFQAQLDIISKQPSFIERVNSKLEEQERRAQYVKIALKEALDPGGFDDFKREIEDVASLTFDLVESFREAGNVAYDPFSSIDKVRSLTGPVRSLVDTFTKLSESIIASSPDPATAQDRIRSLKDQIIDFARKAGADKSVVRQIQNLLTVPDIQIIVDVITNVNRSLTVEQARKDADLILQTYQDMFKDKKIPLEFAPFINTDTPIGKALAELVARGFSEPAQKPKQFRRGPFIRAFAHGDIVSRPTVGIFGEDGPEVIVPLSKPQRMIELLTAALSMAGALPARLPEFANGAIAADRAATASIMSSSWRRRPSNVVATLDRNVIDVLTRLASQSHSTTSVSIGQVVAPAPERVPGEIARRQRDAQWRLRR